ncbi:MAG: universal stress protein, partial [Microscillaceae bacterium]|nr:universal stress protein [Microscillaceae bacterium]MDW8460179.1 universal stress protein [Cytophagales bacterium]
FIKENTEKLAQSVDKAYTQHGKKRNPENVRFLVKTNPFIVETIIEIINHYKIDLVVMGTQGAAGLKKVIFGSNTANLIKQVKCDVLAIPKEADYRKPIRRIAMASTLHHVEDELKRAMLFAKFFDATIDVVHVYPVFPDGIDLEKLDNHAFLERLQNIYPKVNLYFMRTNGDNETEVGLAEFLRVYKPDMLIMHPRTKDFWENLLDGSVSNLFVSNTKIPLITLK